MQRLPVINQLRRQPSKRPEPEVENSILLRVLVQALVVVGIIAVDVAAGIPEDELPLSLWAVPLSIAGATWSWYHRRDQNVPVKFLLAIGMLLALAVFFRNLFGQLNDTRLVLAQLLIQVQTLHSFDLPRRKDLGYSMVIGLILLGVAGTLSQTLAFAPVLLVFLVIALPVLILDYRSRLGLDIRKGTPANRRTSLLTAYLSPRRLGLFLVVIVGLGLAIFALMPRFPGYQLQTFPVSAPVDLAERDFPPDSRGIVNPGREGRRGTREGNTQGEVGPGQLDDTFYYGFGSRINQNLRGELKPKVVMRVRSQAEGFWRVLAFDRYTGQGWEISRDAQTNTVQRSGWSYRFFLPRPIILGRTRDVVQTYTVVSELPNLIPALSYPKELYFPTQRVAIDTEGGLRSPGILPEGLTYTVISDVPYRNRTRLRQASTNYPKSIRDAYLQVPPATEAKVRKLTEEILQKQNQQLLARSQQPITAPYEQALFLAQYLKQHYTIPDNPLGLPFLSENDDLVESFLFKTEGGYPDHFSTTLTVMLRSIGIPARLVVGFASGEFNPFTGYYVVRNTDAYAMTEVYFPRYGWFAFDPIPGHPLIPPSIEEDQTFGVLRAFWNWVAGWLPSPVAGFLNGLVELLSRWVLGAVVWLWVLFSSGWMGFFAALILAICFSFLAWLAWNRLRVLRYRLWLRQLPPMESLYQEMLTELGREGFRKHPAQTPLEYASAADRHQPPDTAEVVHEITQAYVSWRYGGKTPNLTQLRLRLQGLKKAQRRRYWQRRSNLQLRME